jgi:hypothetical protein
MEEASFAHKPRFCKGKIDYLKPIKPLICTSPEDLLSSTELENENLKTFAS